MRLYGDLAPWFHLLTAPEDYAVEAARYERLILESLPEAETLLELGSGGGNNASHLKRRFACTLSDLSPQMLTLSRELNPECEHVLGDMRTLRLGRTFDAVFVHDAVAYMTTESDLRDCIGTALAHTRPGGVALFVPDFTRETFTPGTSHGGHDGADGRSLRYLEWSVDPDPGRTRRTRSTTRSSCASRARRRGSCTTTTSKGCFPSTRGSTCSSRRASSRPSTAPQPVTTKRRRWCSSAAGPA